MHVDLLIWLRTVRLARRTFIAAIACLVALVAAAGGARAESLRVMTFNVRVPVEQDGLNGWEHRKAHLADVVAGARPDILATQELKKVQGDHLLSRLSGYSWFGKDRRGGHDDEHMGIFYRRDRLRLIELGNFALSDTPRIPGSISWGHPYPRMVTWGLFESRKSGRRFYVYNTHFPYRAEDEAARTKGAEAIASRIAALPAGMPVILTGDFNTEPGSPAHRMLTRDLVDARVAAPRVTGPEATFHAFSGRAERRIDWILTRGARPLRVHTDDAARRGRYPSDHFPVIADLEW